jgi:heme-degrading monooxygenase HmoA
MICIIWEFDVDPSQVVLFEEIYNSNGPWALLFSQSSNYHGTTLLRDHAKPARYLTMDRWNKIDDFENFKNQHLEAYNHLDKQCERLTLAERKIGIFEVEF